MSDLMRRLRDVGWMPFGAAGAALWLVGMAVMLLWILGDGDAGWRLPFGVVTIGAGCLLLSTAFLVVTTDPDDL